MAGESDGIEEAFEAQLRTALTAATRMAERISRAREDALRRSQAASEQEGRELRSRIAAERAAAQSELSNVYRPDWWNNATPEQIGSTYELAHAWASYDDQAAHAEARIRDELAARYGVDVDELSRDPGAVQDALSARQNAADERTRAEAEKQEAVSLVAAADTIDQQAAAEEAADEALKATVDIDQVPEQTPEGAVLRDDAGVEYDSAERREQFARQLDEAGVSTEQVQTRVRADTSQAKPASAAVGTNSRAPQARKGNASRGRTEQRQRGGRGL